jgi:peptidoglycan hydrolase-like protein with peptidoglycan-binding domain
MKKALALLLVALAVVPLAFYGCKAKTEKLPEVPRLETEQNFTPVAEEKPIEAVAEPAQSVAVETIPPTAAPQVAQAPAVPPAADRNKDIQLALAKAGFYTGAIDGKIGPKTKKAIVDFQKANGLKADGKVGPRTWAALEKYLAGQQ